MSTKADPTLDFRETLSHSEDGVVGLADRLLARCRNHQVHMEWIGEGCRIQIDGGLSQSWPDGTLKKSQLRALIARISVLCRETTGKEVSPYTGSGEIVIAGDCPLILNVSWENSAAAHKLSIEPKIMG